MVVKCTQVASGVEGSVLTRPANPSVAMASDPAAPEETPLAAVFEIDFAGSLIE
jgi:hypothetical protein